MSKDNTRCAGLDVHKKSVVAAVRLLSLDGMLTSQVCMFGATTAALLDQAIWLLNLEVTHVALKSTGESWKTVYNLMESSFTILIVNTAHIKYVPGRKTDVRDGRVNC